MATVEQTHKAVSDWADTWLLNLIWRALAKRKSTGTARLCFKGGREEGLGKYEAVKVEVGEETYLITVRKLSLHKK